MRNDEMHPGTTLARVNLLHNLELTLGVSESCVIITSMNGVFAQELITNCLCERNLVFGAKLNSPPCPAIGISEKSVVLMSSRGVSVDLGDRRCAERVNCLSFSCGRDEVARPQEQLNRRLMPACEMMKASFDRQSVCSFQWIRGCVQYFQSFAHIFDATLIAGGD